MRRFALLSALILAGSFLYAQSILTARDFFQQVSAQYGQIQDYEANLAIKAASQNMQGRVSFKRPDLLRIDFSSPAEQVICFNGDMLTIYIPGSDAILNQSVQNDSKSSANMATPQGLSLLSRYYTIAYENGQDPEFLEEGSEEMVVKLILGRRNTTEAFRYIKMAVNPDTKMIRRIDAFTPQGESFRFDFTNYAINQGIPEQRFVYDPPSSANNYNNFLFSEQ